MRVFTKSSSGASARPRRVGAFAALCVVALAGAGCSETVRTGQSSAYMILERLEGAAGGAGSASTFTGILRSDVSTDGSVFEDNGRVALRLAMKDVTSPTGPTTNNQITINRYRVDFRRTDGRNTPGVDVPYGFEGAIGLTVTQGGQDGVFTLVRAQAKLEAPLVTLRGGGGALVISTIADVTFFGRDQTGRDVTVTGSISVNFADWADSE